MIKLANRGFVYMNVSGQPWLSTATDWGKTTIVWSRPALDVDTEENASRRLLLRTDAQWPAEGGSGLCMNKRLNANLAREDVRHHGKAVGRSGTNMKAFIRELGAVMMGYRPR